MKNRRVTVNVPKKANNLNKDISFDAEKEGLDFIKPIKFITDQP